MCADGDDRLVQDVRDLIGGVCGCLFNAPLDMWIETLLHREMPTLALRAGEDGSTTTLASTGCDP